MDAVQALMYNTTPTPPENFAGKFPECSQLVMKLRHIATIAPGLTEANSHIARVMQVLEGFLSTTMNLSVAAESDPFEVGPAWDEERGGVVNIERRFGFRPMGSSRSVFVVTTRKTSPADPAKVYARTESRWADCDQQTRLLAVALLLQLVDRIGQAIESTTAATREASERAQGVLQALKRDRTLSNLQ